MLIGVPAETAPGETRVAVTPETAKKLIAQGHTVRVQSGAGIAASVTDAAYQAAGAEITDAAGAFGCELVLKVRSPSDGEAALMKPGTVVVGMLNPFDAEGLQRLAAAGLTAFALEAAPRTTRAQSMDVLSSPGQHRRLQGRHDRRRQVPALLPHAHDRRRHRQGRARRHPRRRRRRPAGHRHRQAPGRRHRGLATCAPASRSRSNPWAPSSSTCPTRPHEEKEAAEGVGGYARPMPPELARPPEGRGRQARRRRPTSSSPPR